MNPCDIIEVLDNFDYEQTTQDIDIILKIYDNELDLIEILFMHPYTKIDFLVNTLGIARQTASIYLKEIETLGILQSIKIGKSKYFINTALFHMLRKGI